jgi:hypothetical protein
MQAREWEPAAPCYSLPVVTKSAAVSAFFCIRDTAMQKLCISLAVLATARMRLQAAT